MNLTKNFSDQKPKSENSQKWIQKYNVAKNMKKATFVFIYKNNIFSDQKSLEEIKEEFHLKTNGIFNK